MAGEVNLEIVDHLATVTLNQPTKLNAVSVEMYRQFGEIFTHLSEGETIGAIVLRGAGEKGHPRRRGHRRLRRLAQRLRAGEGVRRTRQFGDVQAALLPPPDHREDPWRVRGRRPLHRQLYIAGMCDIRIAASDAGFGVPVNRIGLTADYEELEGLCELVGLRPMLEVLLEGRIFGADEAVAKNIASRSVVPGSLDDEVAACVDRIARAAPLVNRWSTAGTRSSSAAWPRRRR